MSGLNVSSSSAAMFVRHGEDWWWSHQKNRKEWNKRVMERPECTAEDQSNCNRWSLVLCPLGRFVFLQLPLFAGLNVKFPILAVQQ